MICQKCAEQCHQAGKIGSGTVEEYYYDTATLQECPKCLNRFIEFYSVYDIDQGLPLKIVLDHMFNTLSYIYTDRNEKD